MYGLFPINITFITFFGSHLAFKVSIFKVKMKQLEFIFMYLTPGYFLKLTFGEFEFIV